MIIEKVLPYCMICKKIKIAEGMWLGEEADKKLYNQFKEKFEGRLSHSYCPKCGEIKLSNFFLINQSG